MSAPESTPSPVHLKALAAPGQPEPTPALQQLSIRTSMRNQLPCAVTGLEGTGAIVRVQVLAEPERVPSCFVHGYKHLQVALERY